ncbi:MAG TPA: hypothetical protein VI277_05870 [Candidatus Limnocylindria bacterium]
MSAWRELVLRSDSLEVVLLPDLGARIHRIRAFGHDLLRTPPDPAQHAIDPFFWGAYPMAPWCNRAAPGERELAGGRLDLRANFTDGSAIHGLVFAEPWDVGANGTLVIRRGGPGDPWPWSFEASLLPAIDQDELFLDYRLVNLSDEPMPAGIGLHPWFRRPLELRVPAGRVYETNRGSAPEPEKVAGRFDLRALGPPAEHLDATWTGLESGRIDLAWPHLGVASVMEIATTGANTLIAIATPTAIDAIAVEPQTHGPDPFRRVEHREPDAPQMLTPGEELRMALRLGVAFGQPTD